MNVRKMRSAIISAAAFAIAASAMLACGELTGPESPSTPTNVVVALTSATTATVSWTPSPLSDGVVSYSIYRNGNKVGESTTTSFTDTGLAQQTTYVYSVAANCKGGVISDRSAETPASTVTTVDITPPTVLSTSPANAATGVSRAGTAAVVFSEPMDPTTITTTTFNIRVTSSGAILPGTVTYNPTTRRAEYIPTSPLPNLTNLTVTVTTGAKDLAGNALASAFTAAWTTRDEDGPTVTSSTPASNATGVSATTSVTVTFSEAITAASVNATNFALKVTGGATVPGALTFNGTNIVTFTPTSPLTQGANYTYTVSGVTDLGGNAMPAPFVLTFTVGDNTAPTVISTSPADLATGVALNATISATFSEAMLSSSINTTTFTVRPTAGGANLVGTVGYTAGTNTATFTPSSPLVVGTNYTATITTGARDAANNPLAANKVWTFTTIDTTPPTVSSVSPGDNTSNIPTNTTVQIQFSEAMDAASVTAANNITLKNTGTSATVPVTVTYNAATHVATLTPTALSNSTNYTVTVTTAVKDASGNALAAPFLSDFTTAGAADTTRPSIIGRSPAPSTTATTTTAVTITFSEAIDPLTITATSVRLAATSAPATTIASTLSIDATGRIVTLTPTNPLTSGTNYTVTVSPTVADLAGNTLLAQDTWTFNALDNTPPSIVLPTTPTNGQTNVARNTVISVQFNEAMNSSTITASTFKVETNVGAIAVAGSIFYNASNHTVTFTPTSNLLASTTYKVTVTSGAQDLAGNGLGVESTFTFTTGL